MTVTYRGVASIDSYKTRHMIQPNIKLEYKRDSKTAKAEAITAYAQLLARNPPEGREAKAHLEVNDSHGYTTNLRRDLGKDGKWIQVDHMGREIGAPTPAPAPHRPSTSTGFGAATPAAVGAVLSSPQALSPRAASLLASMQKGAASSVTGHYATWKKVPNEARELEKAGYLVSRPWHNGQTRFDLKG